MIEVIENSVQLAVLFACAAAATIYAIREESRRSALLAMFFGSYVLGDTYWLLYLVCYGHTPSLFYIPYLSWYAAYGILYLLHMQLATAEERHFSVPAAWAGPVFAVVMCGYYMQFGDYAGNVITAALMGILIFTQIRALGWMRTHPEEKARKWFCILTLVFCALEYGAWTASCIFTGDTAANPYYWFDFLVTPCTALLLPAYRRAVRK